METNPLFCGWKEADRLAALDRYEILDTPTEPAFDNIVRMASELLNAPIAALNLIAENRQWFKAEIGLGVREMPLDNSICRFAILQKGSFVVPDTTQDSRFNCNPLVTGAPGLRFYAGELLETPDGLPLGTLCVLDFAPRPEGLTEQQSFILKALGEQVMAQMELRRVVKEQQRALKQRVEIEEALKKSERRAMEAMRRAESEGSRLNALLEAVPVGIGYADVAGKLVLVNTENRRLWGEHPYSSRVGEYVEWKGWWADGSDRHGRRIAPHEWGLARALRGEEVPGDIVEIEPFNQAGARKTILLRATPVRDGQSRIVGSVVAHMDITEQVKAEAALRDSEAKFRTIADAMPQMVWSTLPDGFHDYYNRQWYAYTGMPEGSTDGEKWNGMFHPDDQKRAWEVWRHSLETGEPYEIHYRLRHWTGEYRWTLGRALPVTDSTGKIIRWMGTCTDIHDQKLAEEDLKLTNRRKDEFLAMLAHELRNPLAPISTAAAMLKMLGSSDQRIMRSIEIISRQVGHMTHLLNDLLDVSRVTWGLIDLKKEGIDLKTIIGEAIEQARPLVEARNHMLSMHIGLGTAMVHGDKTRLIQVIVNLINNAAKYTSHGGEITVSLDIQPAHVKLSIKDNGVGMETSLLSHVFEPFTQAMRTSDRSQGGLGLGLSLVKNIVEMHQGRVEAHSPGLGKGSTFTIYLPLLEDRALHQPTGAENTSALASARALQVVIVEDNKDAAEMLDVLLKAHEHDVKVFHRPSEAIKHAKSNAVDVFILDIGLPEMDGYELAQCIKRNPVNAGATLIAMSGYGQDEDFARSEKVGFKHHLVKPATSSLIDILSRMT